VTVVVSVSSSSEAYLVVKYTTISLCLTFSLTGTRVTWLDSQLLGIDMRRNKVNKWAWRKRFAIQHHFGVPLSGVSAVYVKLALSADAVSAYSKRFA